MISTRIRIDQLEPEGFARARRLFRPAGAGGRPATPPLFLLIDGGHIVTALRVPLGGEAAPTFLDPQSLAEAPGEPPLYRGPATLARARRKTGARLAIAVEHELALRLADRIDAALLPGDDLVAQILAALRVGKIELGRGIQLDPDILSPIPVPGFAALQQTFDLLLPDERSAGLFVYERGRLDTSIIVEKERGDVTRLTSHHALGMHPAGHSDFAGGQHRAVIEAMTRKLHRPHVAIFCTRAALADILGPKPGALAQAVALRQALVDPAPSWLVAFAGAFAVAGVAQGASKLLGRFVPQRVKDTMRDTAQAFSPFTPLGFDPIKLFTDLQTLF